MRCSFPTCDHDSSQSSSSGVSFHRFPDEESLRAAWMEALGQLDWKPEPGRIICSKHFLEDFLNNQDQDFLSIPCYVKMCRICFATDGRMYSMTVSEALNKAYETFTDILTADEEHLPRYLCAGCADRLMNCARFRRRSLRAHLMLLDIAKRHGQITVELVRSVIETNDSLNSDPEEELELGEINKPIVAQGEPKLDDANIDKNVINIKLEIDNVTDYGEATINYASVNEVETENVDLKNQDFDACSSDLKEENSCLLSLKKDAIVNINTDNGIINQDVINDEVTSNENPLYSVRLYEEVSNNIKKEYSPKAGSSSSDCMENQNSFISLGAGVLDDSPNLLELRPKAEKVTKKLQDLNEMKADKQHTINVYWEKPFSLLCNETSRCEYQVNSVLSTTHSDQPYSCDVCKKPFRYKSKLNAHARTHSNEKPYSCAICKKAFKFQKHLKPHFTSHSDEKPHSCYVCKKAFKRKDKLNVHLRTHSNEKPYSCNICRTPFNNYDSLRLHLRIHSGEKPFICDVCNKAFKLKKHLKIHFTMHSDEKPYSCDVCKKAFKRRDKLKVHVITHSATKPYSCDICGKTLKTKRTLHTHLKIHSG